MKNFCLYIALLLPFMGIAQAPTEKSLLWEISGNGLTQSSYLYGTIHVICPDEISLSNNAKASFSNTEQLYLELDLDDPNLVADMQKSMQNTTHLRNLLSSKDYHQISDFFGDRLGYSIDLLGMIKPFYLLSFTYSPMVGCKDATSLESLFVTMAKEQGKTVSGLETLKDQIAVFDGISAKNQAKMLKYSINHFDKMQEAFQKMLVEYKKQDLVALMKTSVATNPKSNKYEHLLLDKRNENWVAEIPQIISQKSTFIAVGAAHLAGEKGVISLLRKQGYCVESVLGN